MYIQQIGRTSLQVEQIALQKWTERMKCAELQ